MDGWGSTAGSKKGNSTKELDTGEPKGTTAEKDSKINGSGVHNGGTCKTGEGSNGAEPKRGTRVREDAVTKPKLNGDQAPRGGVSRGYPRGIPLSGRAGRKAE